MSEIRAEMAATVWKVNVSVGASVALGDEIAILESMKMEIPVVAPLSGHVAEIHAAEGTVVAPGDVLMVLSQE